MKCSSRSGVSVVDSIVRRFRRTSPRRFREMKIACCLRFRFARGNSNGFRRGSIVFGAAVVYVTRKIDKARELANDLRIRRNVPSSLVRSTTAEGTTLEGTRLVGNAEAVVSARTKNCSVKLPKRLNFNRGCFTAPG